MPKAIIIVTPTGTQQTGDIIKKFSKLGLDAQVVNLNIDEVFQFFCKIDRNLCHLGPPTVERKKRGPPANILGFVVGDSPTSNP